MITVLYEDNHCLAVEKPAGLLSQADATGDPCVVALARAYLKERYHKPGNVYVGLVHRLDRPVSGVILLAKTSKAAARLAEQFRAGSIEKTYWAIVEGTGLPDSGTWHDRLMKDCARNRVVTVSAGSAAGQEASLAFRVLERGERTTLLELKPHTGRAHQLRVQLASRGYPIVGDRKYGAASVLAAKDGGRRIALHAASLRFMHPTRRQLLEVRSEAPADWPVPKRRGPGPTGP